VSCAVVLVIASAPTLAHEYLVHFGECVLNY